jgi:hypothetical protein
MLTMTRLERIEIKIQPGGLALASLVAVLRFVAAESTS